MHASYNFLRGRELAPKRATKSSRAGQPIRTRSGEAAAFNTIGGCRTHDGKDGPRGRKVDENPAHTCEIVTGPNVEGQPQSHKTLVS